MTDQTGVYAYDPDVLEQRHARSQGRLSIIAG